MPLHFLTATDLELWLSKARTALTLGLPNLGRVLAYRLGIRLGINPVRRLQAVISVGTFFGPVSEHGGAIPAPASQRWWNRHDSFGWFQVDDPGLDHNSGHWTGALRRSGFQPLEAPGWRFYDTAD